ncbi:MAG: 4-hydroxy-tetrahydrodipicolinate synthase [Bacteroidaceae bacterium]|nr:4-hydroxy-tetrahydrodipicolinate synthase [Bacteroidaceae bacterium]
MTNPFRGLGVALITPFNEDGSIDFAALETLVEKEITEGVDFLCVLGTTAEPPTLSEAEKAAIIQTVVRVNNHRVPLMLGAGSNCTEAVCQTVKSVDTNAFDGVLIVAPYYNKPSQEGLYRHFEAVSKASPLPVVLYNVPSRTGVNMTADTVLRIARSCPNVVAVKEASGKLDQAQAIMEGAPEGFEVLSGDDGLALQLIEMGAVGVISVIANAFAAEFVRVAHNLDAEANQHLKPLIRLSMADGNPAGIKSIMSQMGACHNVLRLPLVPACQEVHEAIAEELRRF